MPNLANRHLTRLIRPDATPATFRPPSRRPCAFSLVELIIVVAIIGILAAVAIPRMSRGSRAGAEAALQADLHVFRKAINLYACEHRGAWPAADAKEDTFIGQMTGRTNAAGNIGNTPGVHVYGPYLLSIPPVPVGPNAGATGIEIKNNGQVFELLASKGWVYNHETGEIYANTDDIGSLAVAFDRY